MNDHLIKKYFIPSHSVLNIYIYIYIFFDHLSKLYCDLLTLDQQSVHERSRFLTNCNFSLMKSNH